MYQKDRCTISPISWFIPVFPTIFLLLGYLDYYFSNKQDNWFNGKNW